MKTLAKIFLIISVCFLGIILTIPDFLKGTVNVNANTEYNTPICGVENSPESKEGKKLFKILCASCHKLDKKLIGPALSQVDSILFLNWTTLKDLNTNNKTYGKSGIDYHKNEFGKILSENKKRELYEYLNEQ